MSTTGPATTSPTTTGPDRSGGDDRRHDDGVLLADALSINVMVSLTTGVALLAAAPWWARTLDVATPLVVALGAGLLVFAASMAAALVRPSSLRRAAVAVVAADAGWVLGALPVIASGALSAVGDALLAAVSLVVGILAVAQTVGLRRAAGAPRPGARPVTLRAVRTVAAPPAVAWRAVADAAGYERFAPGIATTTTDGPVADGMVRSCVDEAGRSWREHCTVVEPRRQYRMDVDVATYPRSLRLLLDRFGMTWSVRPTPSGGSELGLTFSGAVVLGVLGRLAMARLAAGAPHEVVVERYAAVLGADVAPA